MEDRLPEDYQKNKLNLVLSNSELDFFEANMDYLFEGEDLREYVQEQINKARRNN